MKRTKRLSLKKVIIYVSVISILLASITQILSAAGSDLRKLDLKSINAEIGTTNNTSDSWLFAETWNLQNMIDGNPDTYGMIYRYCSTKTVYCGEDTVIVYDNETGEFKTVSKPKFVTVHDNSVKPVFIQIDLKDTYTLDKVDIDWTWVWYDVFSTPRSYQIFLTDTPNYDIITGKFSEGKSGRYLTIKIDPPVCSSHWTSIKEISVYTKA